MKSKLISKCLITLGLLLFFTVLLPSIPCNTAKAQAASTDKEKSENYRLNLKSITLVKGKAFTLKVYNVPDNARTTFRSDDQEIASVNEDGVISANKVGDTVITVIIRDGTDSTSLTCDVTVGPPAVSVKWTKSRIIIGIDNVDTLRVILKPYNTAEVARFSSYDSSIVSISTGGRITAKTYGFTYLFAQIEATNPDGSYKYDTCTVIVTNQENVALLEEYFKNHLELNDLPEADLNKALNDFFNKDQSQSTLIKDLDRYLKNLFNLK